MEFKDMNVQYRKLTQPTADVAERFTRWENDPALIPFIRPNPDREALDARKIITIEVLKQRLEHHQMYLIYLDNQLVGEIEYQVDPRYLFKKEPGTAWIGIVIGEEIARGKGIGQQALLYLESEIKHRDLKRMELGVFEFNTNAIKLYQKAGFQEIGRIPDFTFWQGKMWQDIRMEKYV
jgi:RimJ/RimL family protein N-acetyltransferase